jgi:altronate dehydratase
MHELQLYVMATIEVEIWSAELHTKPVSLLVGSKAKDGGSKLAGITANPALGRARRPSC